jgi:hypothetical protein
VVDLILTLGFWSLSGKEDPTATVVFWRGIKALYKLQNTPIVDSLVGAFEILEPLLNEANPDLLRSAVREGQSDTDPLTRALFVILQGFAGRAQA